MIFFPAHFVPQVIQYLPLLNRELLFAVHILNVFREELDKLSSNTAKLKAENLELCQDARAAKTYR